MATPAWQEAWDCFLIELDKVHDIKSIPARRFLQKSWPSVIVDRTATPEKYPPIPPAKNKSFFEQMIKAVRRTGISVKTGEYMEPSLNDNGEFSIPTGTTECLGFENPKPKNIKICLSSFGKNTETLCHEFAHAADFILHGYSSRHILETTAIMAGYLFACKHLGIHPPKTGVKYAQQLGIGAQDFREQKRRILAVLGKMNYLFRKGLKK